jgi:hypothetical protein
LGSKLGNDGANWPGGGSLPPTNIRDLAKIAGKYRADVTLDPAGNLDKETLWAYASLMTHHLFWLKQIPFGYCLSRESTSDLYPDISTNLWSFDVVGLYKASEHFIVDVDLAAQSKATFFIFFRGNSWWVYPAWHVLEWPKMDITTEAVVPRFGHYLTIENSESINPEKPVKKEKIPVLETADLFDVTI